MEQEEPYFTGRSAKNTATWEWSLEVSFITEIVLLYSTMIYLLSVCPKELKKYMIVVCISIIDRN